MKRIAVMTSGGDAPGMNAAIRAVVRTALEFGIKVPGVRQAFSGCLNGDFQPLDSVAVSGILQRGARRPLTDAWPSSWACARWRPCETDRAG